MSNAKNANTTIPCYDYIIAGAGGAGLSLLHYIMNAALLSSKSILVVDTSFQKSNDRTWCFWETANSPFENIVFKKWDTISIHGNGLDKQLSTAPFSYKMIQGIDFYTAILSKARSHKNIHFQEATITEISALHSSNHNHSSSIEGQQSNKTKFKASTIVKWQDGAAIGDFVFSSLLSFQMNELTTAEAFAQRVYEKTSKKNSFPFLWQHFKGRVIACTEPIFDKSIAKLMDFNVPQHGATAFMYQLPLSANEALVEYTLFSENILPITAYDKVLDDYLVSTFPSKSFKIIHEEMGAIPMTQIPLDNSTSSFYTIGALGGAVKASTGYAFQFIQQQCKNIVLQLERGLPIQTKVHTTRHQFYDAVLLHILLYRKMKGAEIFTRIFARNKAATVFKFLSNSSSLWEDIQIMRTLPIRIFLPAAIKVLLQRL